MAPRKNAMAKSKAKGGGKGKPRTPPAATIVIAAPAVAPKRPKKKKNVNSPVKTHSMHGHATSLLPASHGSGTAFHHSGMFRAEYTKATTTRVLLAFTNNGFSPMVGSTVIMNTANTEADWSSGYQFILPLLNAAGSSNSPTSGRATRMGVSVLNSTPALSQGGRVYILNSDSRMSLPTAPTLMNWEQTTALWDSMKAHPDTKAYSGQDYSAPRHYHSTVVDPVKYEAFEEWEQLPTGYQPTNTDRFWASIADWGGNSVLTSHRPMSTTFVLLETSTAPQEWTFTARAQYYTRWPLNTIGNANQTQVPKDNDPPHLDPKVKDRDPAVQGGHLRKPSGSGR
jgi:hypothetical protein